METRRRVINADLIKTLSSLGCVILKNESLSKHCSFKIGGRADFFIEIPNEQSLLEFLKNVGGYKFYVLGCGTNVLFSDEGYRGAIVSLTGQFKEISVCGEEIFCGSGALISNVLNISLKYNLTGLECVAGIPGTVGGAVCGNAGSKDKWIDSVVGNVEVYEGLKKEVINKKKIIFSYRKSNLTNCIVTNVNFVLKKDTENDSLSVVSDNIKRRLESQSLDIPNAGSIFKNPDGYSAGKLIEEVGLKGTYSGSAQISKLHGNFIINTGGASSKDVVFLIELIKEKVKEKFNLALETEIKIIK
ncbi:MAG: UDP-N-acetylmuramate dehydrogenase [Endomicrobium sp.]|uniref:UDP-N-acetylmuramate dehydrogenase n=1 Tax=Candidatus Endomicrobiellum pyrsonymphae TaxID=1408203 RepID=UPI003580AA66|nr:UDP-N-acetylmuramate dehydrogenase [Endomicrobium sp.]